MATKRKHETLNLTKKMEILRKLDNGANQKSLAAEYNVGRATIYDINKNRKRIEHYVNIAAAASGTTSRQTLRAGKYRRMEDELYVWFLKERSKRTLTGDTIKLKALEIQEKFDKNNDFQASDGWLLKFKARYGLHSLSIEENAAEKIGNKDFRTPFLKPEENDEDSEDAVTTNEDANSDPCESCEVIWLKDEVSLNPQITHEDALAAVDISFSWAEENDEPEETLDMLRKLKDRIFGKFSLVN